MQAPGIPSVDQLLVLLTVVEEGSFTAAARRLRRATSAISYAIVEGAVAIRSLRS
jgi:DNA-binding transcriptional LysR family regulator